MRLTTNKTDNNLIVAFDKPLPGDYAAIATLQFVDGLQAWGWPSVCLMVHSKTANGFRIDVYNTSSTYEHLECIVNWIALPVR